jgi:PIF1-like helicase
LLNNFELAELCKLNPDSLDIYKKGSIDHYAERPEELNNICLAEFVAFYTFTKNGNSCDQGNDDIHNDQQQMDIDEENIDLTQEPSRSKMKIFDLKDKSGKITQRTISKVIRYCKFNKIEDASNYYREMILLFFPWRNEIDEVENVNHEEKFGQNCEKIMENYKKFNYTDIDFENILQEIELDRNEDDNDEENQIQSARNEEENNFLNVYDYDDSIVVPNIAFEIGHEAAGIDRAKKFICPDQLNNKDYFALCDSLNDKQRDYLMHMISCFKNEQEDLPVYHFISGGAGVGKSRLISAIFQSILRIYRTIPGPVESNEVMLVAYTGKAAHNIGGMTAHAAFHLSAGKGKTKMGDLSPDLLNTITAKLYNMKLLIIDEISMLSSDLFFQINKRLCQIFKSKRPFGGKSVIVVGDFNQLKPVGGLPVFKTRNDGLATLTNNYLWESFKLFELDEIMRQKDLEFAQALNRLAVGRLTPDDITMFNLRVFTEETLPEEARTAIRLMKRNADVDAYNTKRLAEASKTTSRKIIFEAQDTIVGQVNKRQQTQARKALEGLSRNDTQSLETILHLVVGVRYMVSVNIDVSDGLFNGASGTLRHIEILNRKAEALYIEFDDPKIGEEARKSRNSIMTQNNFPNNWTPITRCRKIFNVLKKGTVQVI